MSNYLTWDEVARKAYAGEFDKETESFRESCVIGLRSRTSDPNIAKAVDRLKNPPSAKKKKEKMI